jgi:(1->4)-alpha-D-glucan 1-alpha-D-glucosylmutase
MTRLPTATYRLQFGGDMDFAAAAALAPYLSALGISHLYASPVFEAAPGSTHGYDVTDPNALSASLGGEAGFRSMATALKTQGIGLILDIVPNHMAAHPANPWLADVMLRGRRSAYADVFDIDWAAGDDRLVLPVLGTPLAGLIEAGEVKIEDDPDFGRALRYYDQRFPISPGTETGNLAETLDRQAYRLVHWQDLGALNYRRFFDITGLIGVRQEDPEVFARTHRLVRALIEDGLIDGLRVDHIDGLRDPGTYLERLAGLFPDSDPPPIWVEKIREDGETLPKAWPVAGDTGYGALVALDRLFMPNDPGVEAKIDAAYGAVAGPAATDLDPLRTEAKRAVIAGSFGAEFDGLSAAIAAMIHPQAEADAIREALVAIAVSFHRYRTYLPGGDMAALDEALHAAAKAEPSRAETIEAVGTILRDPSRSSPDGRIPALDFQQLTGPVMAKGTEDTLFYRSTRFVALNEVGGDPGRFSIDTETFHRTVAAMPPASLIATATHDTKRGEDTRIRLIAAAHDADGYLAEMRAWWAAIGGSIQAIAAEDRFLLFQCAFGIYDPTDGCAELSRRLSDYAVKAAREAKRHTFWTDPDKGYEAALKTVAQGAFAGEARAVLHRFVQKTADAEGQLQASRLILKATIPGIPDIYQGTEGGDRSLVDPDNRRTPDFAALAAALEEAKNDKDTTRIGLLASLLKTRQAHADFFATASYEPQQAAPGLVAFERKAGDRRLRVMVRRVPDAQLPRETVGEPLIDPRIGVVEWVGG